MTFLGLEARTDLPKVPYPTALDFFVFLSFAFIFATIIQVMVILNHPHHKNVYVYFTYSLQLSITSPNTARESVISVQN